MNIFNGLKFIEEETKNKLDVSSLEGRVRVQKLVFLLKEFGYQPAKHYEFRDYIHGPHSSGLAREYFSSNGLSPFNVKPDRSIPQNVMEIIKEADAKGITFLGALTSLLSQINKYNEESNALKKAKELQPYLDDSIWDEVVLFLRKYWILIGR
ncbi:MAG: hypothetical protein ACYDAO_00245 [Thermoplasmataceae archaeon]